MRVYLETLGCRLNYAEMASLGRRLAAAGHIVADSAADADLCVLNTCAVTGEAARQSRQLARQMARANPESRLIVTGCYASLEGETVGKLPNVTLVVGNDRKDELLLRIEDMAGPNDVPLPVLAHPAPRADAGTRTRAFIKVQDGCRNRCSFCVVTLARGEERSRPVAEIVGEVAALHDEGYQEAVLTGVHLGGYGSDLGSGLRELVAALLAETNIPRLRLSSLEPFDVEPGFFDLWPRSGGRLMPHLHLPAQSGSDAVLKRMARRNRVAGFEGLVAAARERIAGLTVTTDVIVGFPGETEDDFEQTMAFARRVAFAHLHIFPYSARQGTAASRFSGQVPEPERKRRARRLAELDAEMGLAVRESFIGQMRAVLWESLVEDNGHGPVWSGLTDNYLRVQAGAASGADLRNTVSQVQLTGVIGEHLTGTIL
jgi:threonylcarbamoyladenosine tRNA methylthiotransferase MtaB